MNQQLIEATRKWAKKYQSFKRAEQAKDKERKKFFEALTNDLESQPLARKTVRTPEHQPPLPELEKWVKTYHPGWRMVSVKEGKLLLEQDPTLMKHRVVIDGMVYGRDAVEGGPTLDEERLLEEDPDLYYEVTKSVRVFIDPSEWTSAQAAELQAYMRPGKVTIKIAAPRKAKEDDA